MHPTKTRAAALLLALAAPAAVGAHDWPYVTTYYVDPMPTVVVPTVVSAVPTAFYSPVTYTTTSANIYTATSVLEPTTTYVPAAYTGYLRARRGLLGRVRYYEDYGYTPTSLYVDAPLVTTSFRASGPSYGPTAYNCVEVPASAAMPDAPAAPRMRSTGPSRQSTPMAPEVGLKGSALGNEASKTPPGSAADSPVPKAPAPEDLPANPIQPPPDDPKPERFEARKFLPPGDSRVMRAAATAPALLNARVLSALDGKPEPKAEVLFVDAKGRHKDRKFTADDNGRFSVPYLPEGDWAVKVVDAKGVAVDFADLTVSGGRVLDQDGRAWSTLTLNR